MKNMTQVTAIQTTAAPHTKVSSDVVAIAEKQPRIHYLLTCAAGKARPDTTVNLQILGGLVPAWFSGDLEAFRQVFGRSYTFLAREGCERAPDPAMREWCSVLLAAAVGVFGETFPDNFDWSTFGKDGELLRQGIYAYDYDKHHVKLNLSRIAARTTSISTQVVTAHSSRCGSAT